MSKNNISDEKMQKEYDFSGAEKGKFYSDDLELEIPITLDEDIKDYYIKLSGEKAEDLSKLINDVLRENIRLHKILNS